MNEFCNYCVKWMGNTVFIKQIFHIRKSDFHWISINFFLHFLFSECISSIESELNLNKSMNSWKSDDSAQDQYILSVNHKDSLRQQLSRIRHLRDEYETHLRLREALIKMMRISKSRDCDTEWKENSRTLISIEKQLELMMGS